MSVRAWIALAAIAVAFWIAVPHRALGQGQPRRDGFDLYSTSVAVAFDSGISVDSTSPFGDQLIHIVPTAVAYTKFFGRSELRFIYEPEIEIFASASEFNTINHAGAVAYLTRLSRNVNLNINGTFLRTNDRSRQTASLTLTPRGRYVAGVVTAGLSYNINSATSLRLVVNGGLSQTGLTPTATAADSLEQVNSGANVDVSRVLDRSHAISGGYGYLWTSNRDPRLETDAGNQQDNFNLGYRFTSRFRLNARASVGVIRRREVGDDTYTYSVALGLTKAWDPLSVSGRYNRSTGGLLRVDPTDPDPSGQVEDPLLTNRIVQTAGVSIRGEFARRVGLSQNFRWTRTPTTQSEFFESISGGTSLSIRAGNTVAPYVTIGYFIQSTRIDISAVSRFRISAGIQFYWWDKLTGAPQSADTEPARSMLPGNRTR